MAWAMHTVVLKFMLYLMGIPSAVPFLETVAYAGYPFVLVCLSAFIGAAAGAVVLSTMGPPLLLSGYLWVSLAEQPRKATCFIMILRVETPLLQMILPLTRYDAVTIQGFGVDQV